MGILVDVLPLVTRLAKVRPEGHILIGAVCLLLGTSDLYALALNECKTAIVSVV